MLWASDGSTSTWILASCYRWTGCKCHRNSITNDLWLKVKLTYYTIMWGQIWAQIHENVFKIKIQNISVWTGQNTYKILWENDLIYSLWYALHISWQQLFSFFPTSRINHLILTLSHFQKLLNQPDSRFDSINSKNRFWTYISYSYSCYYYYSYLSCVCQRSYVIIWDFKQCWPVASLLMLNWQWKVKLWKLQDKLKKIIKDNLYINK